MKKIAAAHPKAVLLREKDLSEAAYTELAREVLAICAGEGVPCILHSFTRAAAALGAPAVHLPLPLLRQLAPEEKKAFSVIGASCHTDAEEREACAAGCGYIIAGHIFETDCKKGLAPRGTEFLKRVRENYSGKLYAIGGISPENAVLCKTAGAQGVCVMSGFMTCENVFGFYEKFKKAGYFNENR